MPDIDDDDLDPDLLDAEDDNIEEGPDDDPDYDPDAPPEEDDEPADEPEEKPQPSSRGKRRRNRVLEENRDLRERLARLEGQLSNPPPSPPPPPRDPAAEAQRERELLATMTPDEQADYRERKLRGEVGAAIQNSNQNVLERLDRAEFRELCRADRAVAAVKDEVESLLAAERRAGRNPSREFLANWLIGHKARQALQKRSGKTSKRAADNVRRNRVDAPSGGADVGSQRQDRKGGKSAKELLAGVNLMKL